MSKETKLKVHESNPFNKDFIAMTLPLLAMGMFYNGPRVLVLAFIAVITAKLADRWAAMLRGRKYDATENLSTAVALIIVLMLPATVKFRVVIMAVLVAVLVGKEAFGGVGSYPFNPAAVGYCVAAVSWPAEIFRYPAPINWLRVGELSFQEIWQLFRFEGVNLVEGPSYYLKNGGLPHVDTLHLLMGNYAGPLGVTASVVIVACGVYLLVKKRLPLAAPLGFLGAIAFITFFFPRAPYGAWQIMPWFNWLDRLQSVKYELLSGALVFSAVFLVDEPGTLPKNTTSRLIYGLLLGFAATMFRYYGTYEMGTCFAFLLVNAVSGYFDRAIVSSRAKRQAKRTSKRKGAAVNER